MPSSVVDILGDGGLISQRLPTYELREEQLCMAQAVQDAFRQKEHLLVEAGTGVGKSFAYLIPAIQDAVEHGSRVVISTNTIALQEQLITKDIPFLLEALPYDIVAELVKGRANYLGIRRLARASTRQQLLFSDPEADQLWAIEDWAYKTKDGSMADLPLSPLPSVWEMVRSDRNDCMGKRCPHYQKCFYQRARIRAQSAQLLIVNHALLFSDLALREGGASLLPDYQCVVLDEAHTVEDVAGNHFGLSVSDTQISFLLSGLYNERTKRGVLAAKEGKDAIPLVKETRNVAAAYFNSLAALTAEHPSWNGRLKEPPPVQENVSSILSDLHEALKGIRNRFDEEQARFEITSVMERCREFGTSIAALHTHSFEGCVYWLDVSGGRRRQVGYHARPIDVAAALKESLFDKVDSVVLTSATLTTGGKPPFGYVQKRLGLDEAECKILGSPFDYNKQVTLHIETRMPDPSDRRYTAEVSLALKKYLRLSDGRAFVLFTSYRMLRDCADMLAEFVEEEGMTLLKQGEGASRSQLIAEFKSSPRSVLFGTDTFWGGVDVPGEALSNVIITKLPFSVPDHPVVEAKIEHIKEHGGSAFMDFQLPEAILKFKQGFGRLIRRRSDRGMVVILDPRVKTKGYGRRFLDALPDCRVEIHDY